MSEQNIPPPQVRTEPPSSTAYGSAEIKSQQLNDYTSDGSRDYGDFEGSGGTRRKSRKSRKTRKGKKSRRTRKSRKGRKSRRR